MIIKSRPSQLSGTQWGDKLPTRYYSGASFWAPATAPSYRPEVDDAWDDLARFTQAKVTEFSDATVIAYGEDVLKTSRGRRDKFNPVDHVVCGPVLRDVSYVEKIVNPRYYLHGGVKYYHRVDGVTAGQCSKAPYGRTLYTGELNPSIGEFSLQNLRSRAYYSMLPRFQGDLDLLLFLAELKDVKDIFRLIKPKSIMKSIRWALGAKKRVPDPTRPLAEAHLLYNFGIKPLIDELGVLIQQLYHAVDEAQSQFGQDGETEQTSHYTELIAGAKPVIRPRQTASFVTLNSTSSYTLYTGTMSYKYDYTMRSKLDTIVKYWGLDLSFDTLYNMVPFSFLLDYFVDLGKCIKFMEVDKNVDLYETTFGESVKTYAESGQYFVRGTGDGLESYQLLSLVNGKLLSDNDPPALTAGWRSKHYVRRPVFLPRYGFGPALPGLVQNPLTTGQQQNIAALVRAFL